MYAVRVNEPNNNIDCGFVGYNVYWDTEATACTDPTTESFCVCDSEGVCTKPAVRNMAYRVPANTIPDDDPDFIYQSMFLEHNYKEYNIDGSSIAGQDQNSLFVASDDRSLVQYKEPIAYEVCGFLASYPSGGETCFTGYVTWTDPCGATTAISSPTN